MVFPSKYIKRAYEEAVPLRKKVFLLPTIIIGFVLLFIIGSIGVITEKGYGISVGRYLGATNGTAMFIRDNSPIQMSNRTDRDLFDNLEVGDKILVIHDGIAESYPGRTGAYWCMKLEGRPISRSRS